MEQDLLPIVVVLVAIFAAMLALAALVVPADATAHAASVDGSAGQGTDTAAAAGPDVGDGEPGFRVGAWDRPPERSSGGPTSPAGAGRDLGAVDGRAHARIPEPLSTSPTAAARSGSSFTALPRR